MAMVAEKRNRNMVFLCFSLVFGIVYSLGYSVLEHGRIGFPLFDLLRGAVGCWVFLRLGLFLTAYRPQAALNLHISSRKLWLLLFLALICSYGTCLLVYFPGVGMNDGLNILLYGMGISNQFPVFYTAYVCALRMLGQHYGNYQLVIAVYSVLQVLAVSAISACLLTWLSRKRIPSVVFYLTVFYYICSPLLAMYSISMLKDTVFSLLLAVLCALLYEIADSDGALLAGRKCWLLLLFTCFGVVFLRNNGPMIVFLLLLVLYFKYPKIRKRILAAAGAVMLGLLLSTAATNHFSGGQLFQEAAAIPIQQIAACVKEDGVLSEDQKVFIDQIMPLETIKAQYNPHTADPIKWGTDFNRSFFEANRLRFLKVWLQAFPNNRKIYVLAWLQQTFWFWAPRQASFVECYFTIENDFNPWLSAFMETYGIHDSPLLPQKINGFLRQYYAHAASFFREGVCFWLLLALTVLLRFKTGQRRCYLMFLPVLFLWLTLMISTPLASAFRYAFVYAYVLPLFSAFLFLSPQRSFEQA